MPDRWVMDEDYPNGHLVPMTLAEEAQHEASQAEGAAILEFEASRRVNQTAIRAAVASRIAILQSARVALSSGTIFAALSAGERTVIDLLLQGDLQLGRLALELFDATDSRV